MPARKRKTAPKSEVVSTPDVEPSKLKVAELKEELTKLGLDTSGKKAELVARLEQALTTDTSDGPSPPKKAKSTTKAPAKKGVVKKEPTPPPVDESDFSKAVRALTSAKPKKTTFNRKVDLLFLGMGHSVYEDWDCMLNQTNIGQNNNKFYVIQLLQKGGQFTVYTRWGRVGETGKNEVKYFSDVDEAKKVFCKKFQDKTKNKWENRDKFQPAAGKYTLLEMDDDDEEEEVASKMVGGDETDGPPAVIKPCSLDAPTQRLVKLIFDNDMFNNALKSMEIDTKKMPLGKLSKLQIAKGFEALEAIETALNAKASGTKLAELTSKFYTIIPHDFGRRVPAPIRDHETLQKKFDMLVVLGDIEIAQGLKTVDSKPKLSGEEVPHPIDINYSSLNAPMRHINKTSEEFKILEQYLQSTQPQWRKLQLIDVWSVDRDGEGDRFKAHDGLENRRLLWHGTNVAVVAAILKSGLRIMPHSGGRVGKGIYFASECSKSASYVRTAGDQTGIMFLNEVALGKEKHITKDDWTLTAPPASFDSIIAKGRTEPDPKKDTSIKLEGKTVVVPQGPPIPFSEYSSSSFSQSEYLVYKESQARIRYLLKLKFG